MAATASDLVTPVLLVAMPQVLDPFFHKSVVLLIHHQDEGSFGFIVNRPTGIKVSEILHGLEVGWRGREDALAYFGGPVQPQLGTVLFEAEPRDAAADAAASSPAAASSAFSPRAAGPRSSAAGSAGPRSPAAGSDAPREEPEEEEEEEQQDPSSPAEPAPGDSVTQLVGGISLTQHVGDLSRLAAHPPARFRLYLGYAGWGAGQLIAEILRNDWLTAPVAGDLIFAPDPELAWNAALQSVGVDPSSLPSWTAGASNGEEDAN
jgi:putative transcriptional regulator